MPYIKINDLDVFYEEFGRGDAFILISEVTEEPSVTALNGTAV